MPLGVVLFIYESRPNVTADAAALCLKSGNAVILRGGKEAAHSAAALFTCVRDALAETGLPLASVQLVDRPDRELVPMLLGHGDAIDVAIPRGGKGLIRAVTEAATMPVLKHLDGNCHLYVHSDAARWQRRRASRGRHARQRQDQLPRGRRLQCGRARPVPPRRPAAARPRLRCPGRGRCRGARRRDGRLQLDAGEVGRPRRLGRGVPGIDRLDQGRRLARRRSRPHQPARQSAHGRHPDSRHPRGRGIRRGVDSASVTVNASTRFADGGEYGFGAEIGISTDKLHARGPMGAADLCSYKWIVTGDGHLRP